MKLSISLDQRLECYTVKLNPAKLLWFHLKHIKGFSLSLERLGHLLCYRYKTTLTVAYLPVKTGTFQLYWVLQSQDTASRSLWVGRGRHNCGLPTELQLPATLKAARPMAIDSTYRNLLEAVIYTIYVQCTVNLWSKGKWRQFRFIHP